MYQGAGSTLDEAGIGATVVLHMMVPLYDCNHHVYSDNFSSISLASKLKDRGTLMIGTARINRRGWPKEMKGVKNWRNRWHEEREQIQDSGWGRVHRVEGQEDHLYHQQHHSSIFIPKNLLHSWWSRYIDWLHVSGSVCWLPLLSFPENCAVLLSKLDWPGHMLHL